MNYRSLLHYLEKNGVEFKENYRTSELVTFRIGGDAKIVIFPKNRRQLIDILRILKNNKFVVIGNGSNCYFTDGFYDGAIIATSKLNSISRENNLVVAECGAPITKVSKFAFDEELCGLEFSYGIPGTVGGAVAMNASAFGSDISTVLKESLAYDICSDKLVVLSNAEHIFSVKSSVFRKSRLILILSKFELQNGSKSEIYDKMNDNISRRREAQPLNLPSAGSAFIKPEHGYASQMIDSLNLKGYTVGGAQVSTKHAGFIVNIGGATAADVNDLIEIVKRKVNEQYKINLEKEIIYIE